MELAGRGDSRRYKREVTLRKPSKDLSFLIDEDVCQDLHSLIPDGRRSQLADAVFRGELAQTHTENALENLVAPTKEA